MAERTRRETSQRVTPTGLRASATPVVGQTGHAPFTDVGRTGGAPRHRDGVVAAGRVLGAVWRRRGA